MSGDCTNCGGLLIAPNYCRSCGSGAGMTKQNERPARPEPVGMTRPADVQKLTEIVTNLQHWLESRAELANKRRAGDCGQTGRAVPGHAFFSWNPTQQVIMVGSHLLWSSQSDDNRAPSFADCKAVWHELTESGGL